MESTIFATPIITDEGKKLLIRALSGEKITFTTFKVGNGELSDDVKAEQLSDLINPIFNFSITNKEQAEAGYLKLTGSFDNTAVDDEIRWRELGLFCKGENEDDPEVLYAYCNDSKSANTLKPSKDTSVVVTHLISFIIAIGDAENVTAILSQSTVYVLKDEFVAHQTAPNAHGLTATDIGLDKVPNVETNNQTPTYEEAKELSALTSGEILSTAFGKIATAVKELISHIKSTGNVHKLKAEDINAAADKHEHSTADIISGTLGVKRGGTGAATAEEALANLGGVSKQGDTMAGELKVAEGAVKFGGDKNTVVIYSYTDIANPTTEYRGLSLSNSNMSKSLAHSLKLVDKTADNVYAQSYLVFGAHNKPSGSYSGNGVFEDYTLNTKNYRRIIIGNVLPTNSNTAPGAMTLLVTGICKSVYGQMCAIVTHWGTFIFHESSSDISFSKTCINWSGTEVSLLINEDDPYLNEDSNYPRNYQLL